MRCLRLLSIIFAAAILSACSSISPSYEGKIPTIRVAILTDVPSAQFKMRGSYQILDPKSGQILEEGRLLDFVPISVNSQGFEVGQRHFAVDRLRLNPSKDVSLWTGDKERRYRGVIDLIKTGDGMFTAVNILSIEDYVRGVLYHEVSHRWPIEAIKAQAVATRTYAFYRKKMAKDREFDVTNDVYSQVYGGRTSEKYRTNIAVNQTFGQILIFNGEILPAYFHACCGGHTEDASELWKHQEMYPLKGKVCVYCAKSPYYHWEKNYQLSQIQEKLNANGYNLWLIKDIKILERTASGRAKTLEITTRDGKAVQISGKDFRDIIGPNEVRNLKFDIKMKGYFMDLVGQGWGHGVGMCQWGAREMAEQHYDYQQILNYYYSGSQLVDYRKSARF